ncbi:MAG: tetratricopeptide repeat protein [Brevinematales bacterium]|nr:tetratricopeptide repeat protein [Brevinematales bacterium]
MGFTRRIRSLCFSLIGVVALFAPLAAQDPTVYLNEGIKLYQEERYYQALDSFRNALQINPYYGVAYRYLAEVYFAIGAYSESLSTAMTALKYAHNDVDAMLLVANSYRELGKYKDSENYYNSILKLFPSYSEVYRNMGILYLKLNKMPQAFDNLQKAVRLAPELWLGYISLGDYYFQLGIYKEAENNYQKAFELNSRDRLGFYYLADFYYKIDKYSSAISLLEKGETLFENFVSGINLLGDCYLKSGNNSKALEKYDWLLNADFKKSDDFLKWLYYKMAWANEAISIENSLADYKKAYDIDPKNQFIKYSFEKFAVKNYPVDSDIRQELAGDYYKQALTDYKNGNMIWYLLRLKRTVYLNPFHSDARLKIVEFYELKNDYMKAYDELKGSFIVDKNYKIKDKLEAYEWKIQNKKMILEKPELLQYKGVLLVDSDYYNFGTVFPETLLFYSKYFEKFKFTILDYRKKDGINNVLEYIRKNNYHFFVIIEMTGNHDVLKFTVFDTVGKEVETLAMNFHPDKVDNGVDRFFSWMDGVFPTIGLVKSEKSKGKYILSMGKNNGLKNGDKMLVFDIQGDIRQYALLKVDAAGVFESEASVVSNMGKTYENLKDKKVIKSDTILKKHLTKLKRILVY